MLIINPLLPMSIRILTLIILIKCTKSCCSQDYDYSDEGREMRLNASRLKIHETQRFLSDQPVCGTIQVEYFIDLLNSTIQLGSHEELFTILGNETRSFWLENVYRFTGTTTGDNCVYFSCGSSADLTYVNEDLGPCEQLSLLSEALPLMTLKGATSLTCVCSDPDCDKSTCSNVELQPEECARLYTETLCQECYSESIKMPRIGTGNGSKSGAFAEHLSVGNTIKSAVVNEGCEVWIEKTSVYRSAPLQTLKPGPTNTLTKLDPEADISFKCYSYHRPPPGIGMPTIGNPNTIGSSEIAAIVFVTILIVVLLACGILLAWRKSAKVEKVMRERTTISKIDLDEFFNGKPIPSNASPVVAIRTPQEKHYATVSYLQNRRLNEDQSSGAEVTIDIALSKPYEWKWEIPKRFIKKSPIRLGKGEFGDVFTGLLSNLEPDQHESVAIKEARQQYIKALLMEIKILSYIGQHPNIVNMLGASVSDLRKGKSDSVWLVLELCENGSLKSFLDKHRPKLEPSTQDSNSDTMSSINIERNPSNELLSRTNLCKWSLEIARGMEFLEQKKILHIDLASRNVLLDSDLRAKIGDFGSARKLYSNVEYWKHVNEDGSPNEPLAFKWMALESLKNLVFTPKSDVWSYGVTIWEIFEFGEEPYQKSIKYDALTECLIGGMRLPKPTAADDKLYSYMRRCWNEKPTERPTFKELQELFQELLDL